MKGEPDPAPEDKAEIIERGQSLSLHLRSQS